MDTVRWAARSLVKPDLDEVGAIYDALRPGGPGVMVDVGAHYGSSLARFARDGWTVHAFEPDPMNRQVLLRRIAGMAGVTVDARAVGPDDGRTVMLYTSAESSGISTLHPFHESHEPTIEVRTVRLDTYLTDIPNVTFLKVDVEGQDFPVLRTFPWSRLRPRAVLTEFEDRKTEPLGYSFQDQARFLSDLGYEVLISEWYPVAQYGRRHRWRSLDRYPGGLKDARSWGNLIAVDSQLAPAIARAGHWPARSAAFWRKLRDRAIGIAQRG